MASPGNGDTLQNDVIALPFLHQIIHSTISEDQLDNQTGLAFS